MMRNCFSVLFCLFSCALLAQPKLNSPYTLYGLGNIAPRYFAAQAGQGGLTTAFSDPYHLNLANPASFASLRSTSLETGLFAQNSSFQSGTSTLNTWSGNLAYFALGFTLKSPINEALDRKKSNWRRGMGISLTPYSLVGYSVETRDTIERDDLGIINSQFEGTGGTYRLAWHGGAKYKNTSFGVTAGWMFGRSKYENTTNFVDSLLTFEDNFFNQYAVGGFVYNTGVQHEIILKRSEADKDVATKWITLGLTAEGNHKLKATADEVRLRSRGKNIQNGQYIDPDTLSISEGVSKTVKLPSIISLGIEYVKADKFKIGAQGTLENWDSYENEAYPGELKTTFAVAAGLEFIPDNLSYNRYLKRVRYRFGGYYRQDPRSLNGQQLTDFGATFGLGFPLILPRQQTSFINLSLEGGRMGHGTAISENYIRMTLGFTLNDNSWFFKRRFE